MTVLWRFDLFPCVFSDLLGYSPSCWRRGSQHWPLTSALFSACPSLPRTRSPRLPWAHIHGVSLPSRWFSDLSLATTSIIVSVPCRRAVHPFILFSSLYPPSPYALFSQSIKIKTKPGGRASVPDSFSRCSRCTGDLWNILNWYYQYCY